MPNDADDGQDPSSPAIPKPVMPVMPVPPPPAPVVRKRGRRVTTEAVPGTDPAPAPVDRRVDSSANDARLQADKPPHWG